MRDGGRDQDDGNIISEQWSALGYTLKVQATELPNTLNVRCERKKGVRGGPSNAYGLQNWQVGAAINYDVRVLNGGEVVSSVWMCWV